MQKNHYSSSPAKAAVTVVFYTPCPRARADTKAFCVGILPAVSPKPHRSPWSACAWTQKAAWAVSAPHLTGGFAGTGLEGCCRRNTYLFPEEREAEEEEMLGSTCWPGAGTPTRGHTVCWISELGVCTE